MDPKYLPINPELLLPNGEFNPEKVDIHYDESYFTNSSTPSSPSADSSLEAPARPPDSETIDWANYREEEHPDHHWCYDPAYLESLPTK